MVFIQVLLSVNLISNTWGRAIYVDCNGNLNSPDGSGCAGCNGRSFKNATTIMWAPPILDDNIVTVAANTVEVSTDVVITFPLATAGAGIQASGGVFKSSTGAITNQNGIEASGDIVTNGCTGSNALINWGGKNDKVTGTAEITWTAPSQSGFDVKFVAYSGTTFGAIKKTFFSISDAATTEAPEPEKSTEGPKPDESSEKEIAEPGSQQAPPSAPPSAAPTVDSDCGRLEILTAVMITFVIGLLKF